MLVKNKLQTLGVAAFAALIGAVALGGSAFAYGPERQTFTAENPADYVTFNSITNNPTVGDERNFVRVRQAGVGNFVDSIDIVPGREYEVYIYYHNNAKSSLNSKENSYRGIALDAKLNTIVPSTIAKGKEGLVRAEITARNARPQKVWDQAVLRSPSRDVALRYIQGSAKITTKGAANGQILNGGNLFGSGTNLGYDSLNGMLPGCDQYSGVITYRFKADFADFETTKTVSKAGANNFAKNQNIGLNDEVEFKITYKNTGTISQNNVNIKEILNSNNFNSYLYPSRYNDEKEMIRYFLFEFINTEEFKNIKNWDLKLENVEADGVIFAILTDSDEELKEIIELLKINSLNAERCVFVILRKHCEIKDLLLEFNAVLTLKKESIEDKILFSEYEVIYEDLLEVIYNYIFMYMHPENKEAIYIYMGEKKEINKKSELTELLSKICDKIYFETPIINNEAINRRELTSLALTSRNKIIAALLRNELELNLGLIGNGQEVSIMRSTLIRTGILVSNANTVELNFNTEDTKINNLLSEIIKFIFKAKDNDKVSFQEIYDALLLPKNHIALRKGLIPIFLAVVFHKYKKEIIIKSNRGELPLNVDTIEQIDASPKTFYLHYLEWDEDKKNFIFEMENLFKDYIIESEKRINSYNFIVFAMKRWYMSLPKVTKELKRDIVDKEAFNKNYLSMLSSLRIGTDAQNLLFKQLVKDFSYSNFDIKLVEDIKNSKDFFDNLLFNIKKKIIKEVKILFLEKDEKNIEKYTLFFIIKQWLKSLKEDIYTQTFVNGTDRCLFLFKNITEDEELFINKLSKLVTDLNIEDWNQTTYMQFKNNLIIYKETAESYVEENKKADNYEENLEENQYKISFFDESEKLLVKKFKKIEKSPRAKLLYNSIEAQLEAMGQSLSEQEKRQVLIEILCKLFQ